jgi:hypothetical protein
MMAVALLVGAASQYCINFGACAPTAAAAVAAG